MEIPKPLSVKFNPAIRVRIKRLAHLLDWSEGQVVNGSVAIVLDLIDDPERATIHPTIYLARQALDFEQAQLHLPRSPARPPASG